jgi:hypothetical protein
LTKIDANEIFMRVAGPIFLTREESMDAGAAVQRVKRMVKKADALLKRRRRLARRLAKIDAEIESITGTSGKRATGRRKGSKGRPKAAAPKKRGRPKGSKNKPRAKVAVVAKKRGRPKGSKNKPKAKVAVAAKKRGRPQVSKSKPKAKVASAAKKKA